VDGPAGKGPFGVLVGFHGYAENAEHMLDALSRIRGVRPWLLVSVQALSRFYNRSDNVVIASWMTRQDREQAIADNIAYVSSVMSAVGRDYSTNDTVVYVGFSQGVAMAYRAAVFGGRRPSGLIALAGDVPPDVATHASQLPSVLLGRGTSDQWYTEAKAATDLDVLGGAGIHVISHVFDGGHVWDETFIARAGEFLDATETRKHGAVSSCSPHD
jgi:predicted esterase